MFIQSTFEESEILPMNSDYIVEPVSISEELIFMSFVRESDTPQPLPKLTSRDTWSATSLLQQVETELYSEKHDMELHQNTFHKLTQTIECSFADTAMLSKQSKQFEEF